MTLDARSFIMFINYFLSVDKFKLIVYLFFIGAIVQLGTSICNFALLSCVHLFLRTATDAVVAVNRVSLICLRFNHHKLLLLSKSISRVDDWRLCCLCDQVLLYTESCWWLWVQNDGVVLSYLTRLFLHIDIWCCRRRLRAHGSQWHWSLCIVLRFRVFLLLLHPRLVGSWRLHLVKALAMSWGWSDTSRASSRR